MKRIKTFIKNNIFGILIFIILTTMFILSIPKEPIMYNTYTLTFYLLSYFKDGFLSRALIGTIFNILGITTLKSITTLIITLTIMFIGGISFFLNKFINTFDKKISVLLVLFFIFNPASFTLMYSGLEIGRFDMFLFAISITSIYLIYKEKCIYLIPFLSLIGILIHENYLLWFSPLICILLLYRYYKSKNKNYLYCLLINIFVLLVSLVLVITHNRINIEEYQFYLDLKKRTDFNISFYSITDYYYVEKYRVKEMFETAFKIQKTRDFIIAVVSYFSFIILTWNLCFKHVLSKFKSKIMYLLMIESCFAPFILFVLGCDYGRWYMYLINTLLVLVIFLCFEYKSVIKSKMNSIKKLIPYVIVFIITFMILYQNDQFYLITYSRIDKIIEFISKLF